MFSGRVRADAQDAAGVDVNAHKVRIPCAVEVVHTYGDAQDAVGVRSAHAVGGGGRTPSTRAGGGGHAHNAVSQVACTLVGLVVLDDH